MPRKFDRRRLASAALGLLLALAAGGARAATVCFEAEHANSADYPFGIETAPGASGGLALSVPQGVGDALAFRSRPGSAVYSVPLPSEGTYTLWLRVWWRDGCSNSVIVRVGEEPPAEAVDEVFERWHWVRAGRWKLAAGAVEVRLQDREDGVLIDQLLLTTEAAAPGDKAAEAALIPGRAVGEKDDWRLLSGPPPAAERAVPDELIPRHTAPPGTVGLAPLRTLVLRGEGPSVLEAWIRNNSLRELAGKAALAAPAGAKVEPGAEQEFKIPAGVALHKVTFKIAAGAELPRGVQEMKLRVAGPDGVLQEQKLLLVRPFQWLVSSALPLQDDGTGRVAKTVGAIENALRNGFPGAVEGLDWSLLKDAHVNEFGRVDLRAATGGKEEVMAYAYTCVTSDREAECLLEVMHDDMIRVWINGRQVVRESYDLTPVMLTRKLVRVSLAAGRNHIMVKLGQHREYWEFGLGFLTPEGAPAPVRGEETAGLIK
jgi:hypothetical protein